VPADASSTTTASTMQRRPSLASRFEFIPAIGLAQNDALCHRMPWLSGAFFRLTAPEKPFGDS
jgi:hypothetical protein